MAHTTTTAKDIVLDFIQALNAEDFAAARGLVHDNMKFIGVMGTREGADVYIRDMEKMKFIYSIRKAVAEEEDVCLFYDINMGGKTVLCSGWYQVEEGKIRNFTVFFDPRPVL